MHRRRHIMHRSARFVVVLTIILSWGCSQTSSDGSPSPRRSNVISQEELVSSTATTAYEAVRQLRPQWLQSRGPDLTSVGGRPSARVAVDNVMRGGHDELNGFDVNNVWEIHFISASDATTRWGVGVSGGIIEVITKARRPRGSEPPPRPRTPQPSGQTGRRAPAP